MSDRSEGGLKIAGRYALICVLMTFALGGCDLADPEAILEGDHYQVEDGRVTWVRYRATPTGMPYREDGPVNADVGTFRVVGGSAYAVDVRHVFCEGKALADADPATFRLITVENSQLSGVAGDRRSVWRYCEKIETADGETFRVVGGEYGVDDERAFWRTEPLSGADPDAFVVFGDEWNFAADGEKVWIEAREIPVRSRVNFRPIAAGYSTDGEQVFWFNHVLEGADLATFRVPAGMHYGRDKNTCWNGASANRCLN